MRHGPAALAAALLTLATGCRAPSGPPRVPDKPPVAPALDGEQRLLRDQLHRLAAEDARSVRR